MPGTTTPTLIRNLLLLHGMCLIYFFAWVIVATFQDLSVDTLIMDAVTAVESSLREVQQRPEEGIHALARIHLPPYTGILHTSVIMLWAIALAFSFRERGAWLLGIFALLMLQEELFLSSERLAHGWFLALLYVIPLLLGAWRYTRSWDELLVLGVFLGWLAVRMFADSLLSPTLTPRVECYAELQAALIFVFLVAPRRIAADGAA